MGRIAMKVVKRNHLVAIAVGALLLSGSNLALAQAGDDDDDSGTIPPSLFGIRKG